MKQRKITELELKHLSAYDYLYGVALGFGILFSGFMISLSLYLSTGTTASVRLLTLLAYSFPLLSFAVMFKATMMQSRIKKILFGEVKKNGN
jgi:hypothetical protein